MMAERRAEPATGFSLFDHAEFRGHEQILFCADPAAGYRGIIAVHSTALGPAVGGTRYWAYESEAAALADALRLSRGMTYKNALARMPFGGGKSVIFKTGAAQDREPLFRAHGRFVESLGGRYVAAEDVGTCPADMDMIHLETNHVAGLSGPDGDPSPWTARGVRRGIEAAARRRWGNDDLAGRSVAIQGCGNVGRHLALALHSAGARLIVTDIDPPRARLVAAECAAQVVAPDEILDARADIFAPCALGGVLDDATIARLRVEIVAGAANNQLLEDRHGAALEARGILYAPDYVVNAGGVISGGHTMLGWSRDETVRRVDAIYDTLLAVFRMAEAEKRPPNEAADLLAERHLAAAREGPDQ